MPLASGDDLSTILALARAGAASRAWAAFVDVGLDDVADDAKVFTLKGRLLKDQARNAPDEARRLLFLRSAQAYADAAALHCDSYPLINAATMSLFAGQLDQMAAQAQQVLTLLETGTCAGETRYWHDATKAEALLLLGKRAEAEIALRNARAHAPQAWEDHATTLRQFRAILEYRREPVDWLAAYAPPKTLYFKGMMGIAVDDRQAADEVAALIADSGAGFAFGALAAGADILIAEAVLNADAELHVILPVSPAAFRTQSVEPYDENWLPRFDSLMEQAASLEILDNGNRLSSAAIEMAAEFAKGRAIDNAVRLESEALPVEVTDSESADIAADVSTALRLNRSAIPHGPAKLALRQTAFLIATDTQAALPELRRHGELAVTVTDGAESGVHIMRQLRDADPGATIAIHALIANEDALGNAVIVHLDRLLQAAAPRTIIATSTAAMLVKAIQPKRWIEPLGELPDSSGASTIYSLGLSI